MQPFVIVYLVVASISYFLVSAAVAMPIVEHGVKLGSERSAKWVAFSWRFGQAVVALLMVFGFWLVYLPSTPRNVQTDALGLLWTLVFGGMYVIGSLVAAMTVPWGNQLSYFGQMHQRLRMNEVKNDGTVFDAIFPNSQARREKEVIRFVRSHIADAENAYPKDREYEAAKSFAAALGAILPNYVANMMFPKKIFPAWKNIALDKSDQIFDDLAAILAYSLCLRCQYLLEQDHAGDSLPDLYAWFTQMAALVYKPSERAIQLIARYHKFVFEPESRAELFYAGFVLGKVNVQSVSRIEIHTWMVIETIELPAPRMEIDNVAAVTHLKSFLLILDVTYGERFKELGSANLSKRLKNNN